MSILLKFCYLFLIFCWVGCGPAESKSTSTELDKEQSDEGLSSQDQEDKSEQRTIVFFGNSLTAGLGLDLKESFPSLIQQKIDSLGLSYQVINAGLSGETTSGGKGRVNWVLNQKPDVFVLELGANDGLRGIPLDETKSNLQEIIDKVKEKNAEVAIVLVGMQIPPNMGPEYTAEFKNIFPELAKKNELALIPFLLDGVAGRPDLNQKDGIHPTAEGQKIVAGNVWTVLKDVIQ